MFWFIAALMLFMILFVAVYIARRICQGIRLLLPKARGWMLAIGVLLPAILMLLGFWRSMLPLSASVKQILGIIMAYSMGTFLYLVMYIVAGDVVTAVMLLLKRSLAKTTVYQKWQTIAVLMLTVLTVLGGFLNVHNIRHVSYEVPISQKCDVSDMNIVLISDLHLGAVGSEARLSKVVDQINGLEPDIVCIAGDFFDSDFAAITDPEQAVKTLRSIRSTYGVYACLGNHDAGGTHNRMVSFLEECNITLLRDEYTVIDDRLVLLGRLDGSPIGGFDGDSRVPFSAISLPGDENLPVIVMDHNPAHIDEYTPRVDLILSGHTHNGQLFPATIITDLMYTVDYGYYREGPGSPHVIVTSGVGYWGMPMRVATNCEIVSIRLTADQE